MRNLLFRNREKQVWLDYSLDILFVILLFVEGDKGWAYAFTLLTLLDIVFLAFFPNIEEKWWYKTLTVTVSIIVVIYVVLAVVTFLAGGAALQNLNLPL
ncbi:MAG: hypothetical protein V4664_00650 [Patescibacteria group bacterium]